MIEAAEFEALMREQGPLVGGFNVRVDAIGDGRITLFMPFREDFIRPGGTSPARRCSALPTWRSMARC